MRQKHWLGGWEFFFGFYSYQPFLLPLSCWNQVISLCHQYGARPASTSMQSDQALKCWLTILISLKMIMDSSKNGGWIIPFKKFSRQVKGIWKFSSFLTDFTEHNYSINTKGTVCFLRIFFKRGYESFKRNMHIFSCLDFLHVSISTWITAVGKSI